MQGILPLLGVIFIVLKLCHVIAWPWFWVLAPFWVGVLIVLGGVTLTLALAARMDR